MSIQWKFDVNRMKNHEKKYNKSFKIIVIINNFCFIFESEID